MCSDVVTLDDRLTVAEAAELVQAHELTTFPILNSDRQCVGVITEMRLRRNVSDGNGNAKITGVADQPPPARSSSTGPSRG